MYKLYLMIALCVCFVAAMPSHQELRKRSANNHQASIVKPQPTKQKITNNERAPLTPSVPSGTQAIKSLSNDHSAKLSKRSANNYQALVKPQPTNQKIKQVPNIARVPLTPSAPLGTQAIKSLSNVHSTELSERSANNHQAVIAKLQRTNQKIKQDSNNKRVSLTPSGTQVIKSLSNMASPLPDTVIPEYDTDIPDIDLRSN